LSVQTTQTTDSFIDGMIDALIAKPSGEDRFTAPCPDWFGGHVFGGLIVAQALSASSATVSEDRRIHSLHGHFLRPSQIGVPFDLRVERTRDGNSFTTRRVTTTQEGKEIFSMTGSYHAGETGDEYQLPIASDLPAPEDLPPGPDDWPIDVRELGATPAGPDGTHRSTARMWLRLKKPLSESPAVHEAVLAYISDMTRTGGRPPSLGYPDTFEGLISLDHAVWFHRPIRPDEWLYYDLHVSILVAGRSLLHGTIHTSDGQLGLSMAQEMLIRPPRAS
jgi:acyl-CoA thioesterase II